MALIQIVAFQDMVCEQSQLPRCAPAFALQAAFRQSTFLRADFSDRVGTGLDFIGNAIQKH